MQRTRRLIVGIFLAAAWTLPLAAQTGQPGVATPAGQKPAAASAGHAAVEKTLIANERAINEAVTKGDKARFTSLVAADSWAVDAMSGRMATADFVKQFDEMMKDVKITSWDITDTKFFWIDANSTVLTYKWVGEGTAGGQPIPSPVWASTVWVRKAGKWQALFHQETAAMQPMK